MLRELAPTRTHQRVCRWHGLASVRDELVHVVGVLERRLGVVAQMWPDDCPGGAVDLRRVELDLERHEPSLVLVVVVAQVDGAHDGGVGT